MNLEPPILVAIEHDDYAAKYVGCTADGKQFFVTTPFVPALGDQAGREFIAVYLFDAVGKILEAGIDDLGPRADLHEEEAKHQLEKCVKELGPIV